MTSEQKTRVNAFPTWFDDHYRAGEQEYLPEEFCAVVALLFCLPLANGGKKQLTYSVYVVEDTDKT